MGKIGSIKFGQARIILDDACVRLFVRYKGNYCSDIRIWKLPKNNNLFAMFRSKNLFWAVSDNTAKTLQGWFYKDGDLLKTLANKIAQCSNEKELKRFCFDLENIFTNGLPFTINYINEPFNEIGIVSIPTVYLVNTQNQIVYDKVGYINWEDESTLSHLKKLME